MNSDVILSLYILWAVIGAVLYLWECKEQECALIYYGTVTNYLYENTSMNRIGCILLAICYYIIFPIFILRSICMLVYWLLHIGRKD